MNFETFLQKLDISPATIRRYRTEVDKYLQWLGKPDVAATKKDLLDYLHYMQENRNLSHITYSRILGILKKYYAFISEKYDMNDITCFIRIRGVYKRQLQPIFVPDDMDMLCDVYYDHIRHYQPSRKELYHYPDHQRPMLGRYIALTLMVYQALKLGEVLKLTREHFDLRKATVHIPKSRRSAERTLSLEAVQMGVLIEFFDRYETPFLPNTNQMERMSRTLKKLDRQFRDFRQIRTSRIVYWIRTLGLRKAQYRAGHNSIVATQKYMAHDIDQLQKDIEQYHPM